VYPFDRRLQLACHRSALTFGVSSPSRRGLFKRERIKTMHRDAAQVNAETGALRASSISNVP
jgi:hypothetical protein